MDIQFNAWLKKYKHPFGAISQDDSVKMMIEIESVEVVNHVSLLVKKDNQVTEYKMEKESKTEYRYHYYPRDGSGLYYYCFKVSAQNSVGEHFELYYGKSLSSGLGWQYVSYERINWYQLTCYEQKDQAPTWFKEGICYQIFPDRFYNGNLDKKINAPKKNSFLYGSLEDTPMYIRKPDQSIDRWDFYGGNLKGIIAKIPYLKELGVTMIYLNPIFEATSNHRYDTNDYFKIDPMLGSNEDFKDLVDSLHQNDMKIILDGVFSHVGKDSRYFNYSGIYGENCGAYRTRESLYFDWFKFIKYPKSYQSWWGIIDLPEIDKNQESFQDFIYGDEGVLAFWDTFKVDGWRLDVADELPNLFIQGVRERLNKSQEKVLIGEVWEDASNKVAYGEEKEYVSKPVLHSVMNYPLRELILDLVNQNISVEVAVQELMQLKENYPKHFFDQLLNNIGTHDTERLMTVFGNSIEKVRLAYGLLFSLPGVPCIYYGDEIGMTGGKDPENRGFFPWNQLDHELKEFCQSWTTRRHRQEALKTGLFLLLYDQEKELLGVYRYTEMSYCLTLVNLSNKKHLIGQVNWQCAELTDGEIKEILESIELPETIKGQEVVYLEQKS